MKEIVSPWEVWRVYGNEAVRFRTCPSEHDADMQASHEPAGTTVKINVEKLVRKELDK